MNRSNSSFLVCFAEEAFALPEYARDIYEPYAEWLAMHDRFDEAQQAFTHAGRPDQSLQMLQQLTHNAVTQHRYGDAGYYYWRLGTECLKTLRDCKDTKSMTQEHEKALIDLQQHQRRAEIYYAYNFIHRYTDEAFTSMHPDALFQTAQYVLNHTQNGAPHGISQVYSLYALAKQGNTLQAYKLARQAYSRLLALRVPSAWRDQIDMAFLTIRTKPYSDEESLLPVCYRCSTSNPLLNKQGDTCINCGHEFVRSFCSFETLPLVKFELARGITPAEAIEMIKTDQVDSSTKGGDRFQNDTVNNVQTMAMGDDDEAMGGGEDDDAFHHQLMNLEQTMDGVYPPITVDAKTLLGMREEEVFVRHLPAAVAPYEFYRSVIPDLAIKLCETCQHFFHEEDYEFHVLQYKCCPFCRTPVVGAMAEGEEPEND